jgi:hypothetical protein
MQLIQRHRLVGTIINDNNFVVIKGLSEDRFNRFRQHIRAISTGNND